MISSNVYSLILGLKEARDLPGTPKANDKITIAILFLERIAQTAFIPGEVWELSDRTSCRIKQVGQGGFPECITVQGKDRVPYWDYDDHCWAVADNIRLVRKVEEPPFSIEGTQVNFGDRILFNGQAVVVLGIFGDVVTLVGKTKLTVDVSKERWQSTEKEFCRG